MNICIFDTETVNLNQPFCYNVGFIIYDTEQEKILTMDEFVIEQIWHNTPLFATAYYVEKKSIYVNRMRAKKAKLEKWGYVTQYISRVFKNYGVTCAYAYNSSFDERVFDFNCDYFKTINPFDNIPIFDIRGLVHNKIAFTKEFQNFCDKHQLYTETGNYSTTAETLTQFLRKDNTFKEEHTALSDSKIELEILKHCINLGCHYEKKYKTYTSIPRKIKKVLAIHLQNEEKYCFQYEKIKINKDKTRIVLQ